MTTYTLNIQKQDPNSNTTSNLSLSTQDAAELVRLLNLSGVDMPAPESTDPSEESAMQMPAMEIPVVVMEQQADYDYGHREPTEEQDEFTITDYNFRGRADLPERLTSARFGSNPLRNDMKESAFEQLRDKYQQFLNESRENEAGEMSPLTANDRDEFDHDPLADEKVVDDGSRSPLSRIERQELPR